MPHRWAPAALLVCACGLGMVLASSGGLRGGTSELPTAGENTSFADSQGAQPDEFGEADLAGLDTTGVDIEFEDNETFSDTELPPNDSLVDLAPSSMWSHSYHRNIKTLYHTTSPDIANRILHSSFHPGNSGWCGGAIYFVDTPYLPRSKYGPQTQSGAVIKAVVDLGRMAYGPSLPLGLRLRHGRGCHGGCRLHPL
mmetsp:Transcript_26624/g.76911  ORF Transcript_26624/g.76911 Transcript_26624/m.76911 type:complete len:197 (+) Transcript_26624:83-673(+)